MQSATAFLFREPEAKLRGTLLPAPSRSSAGLLVLVFVATLSSTASVDAAVRIKIREDGTRVVYEETRAQVAQRTSSRLLSAPRYSGLIEHYANERGLSPQLVQAVIQVESAYNARARSSKGAMGLMQLMPDTARELRVSNAYDPGENIRGGTLYLRQQLDRFSGDLTLALAAYNAGPGAVTQYGGIPPYRETRNYVTKVLRLYRGSASGVVQESTNNVARRAPQTVADKGKTEKQARGKKVYMSRAGNNRIVFTTARPKTD